MKSLIKFSNRQHLVIQLLVAISAVAGAFLMKWTLPWILASILAFYLYSVVGVSMVLHRYYAHRSYEFKNIFLKRVFTLVAILAARGTPASWSMVHRMHHKHADTKLDPHKPDKFNLFSFRSAFRKDFNLFSIKDMITKEHNFINQYHICIIIIWCLVLLIISPALLYFLWILPVFINQISQDVWNYVSHTPLGYRNFEIPDNSRNNKWLWPFILGEAWHNNHHNSPGRFTTKIKPMEVDPLAFLITLIKTHV